MCLIVFAWRGAQGLLLAANRDEFHQRPADAADFWPSYPELLAGRDREAGGTWLGITRSGRFAAITNVRDPEAGDRKAPRSRGDLPVNFLQSDSSAMDYLSQVATERRAYASFNLLVSDGQTMAYLHSHGNASTAPQRLEPGIYGLSNASLDVPWPKVERARNALEQLMGAGAATSPDHDALAHCVSDRQLASAAQLAGHGLEGEMALRLSSQFIVTPTYGTRCTSTLISAAGGWSFRERRFDAQGESLGEGLFEGANP